MNRLTEPNCGPALYHASPEAMSPDLAALVASRICHDLISPLGAIGNGVELLMLDPANSSPEIALISESVASATAKIRFLRLALGLASSEQMMSAAQITAILDEHFRGTRTQVHWQPQGQHSRIQVRRAYLAIMCLSVAMPLGGTILVEVRGDHWRLSASARRLMVEGELWSLLTEANSQHRTQPQQVQFALLRDSLCFGPGLARYAQSEENLHLEWGPPSKGAA